MIGTIGGAPDMQGEAIAQWRNQKKLGGWAQP